MQKISSALDDLFVKEAIGSQGDLPETITYHHVPEANEHTIWAINHPSGNMTDPNEPDREFAGNINWMHGGRVNDILVDPDYRRHGLATELWRRAKEIDPGIQHAPEEQSDDGKAWAQSVGGQ